MRLTTAGPAPSSSAVERTGYADFWELRARHAIPTETTNYVPIILAMTIMAKNAPEYGLDGIVPDAPIEYDTIVTTAPTNLALISDLADAPVSELVQLNPALLRSTAPENFEIRVPKGTGEQIMAGLKGLPDGLLASSRIHRVEAGQTLSSIARLYNSSPNQISLTNNLNGADPAEGDRLVVPAAYQEVVPALHTPHVGKSTKTTVKSSLANRKAKKAVRSATVVAASKAPAAHRPLHPASATLAQLKDRSNPINR